MKQQMAELSLISTYNLTLWLRGIMKAGHRVVSIVRVSEFSYPNMGSTAVANYIVISEKEEDEQIR